MTKTGLTIGFYGGIAVVGEIYQILFMPETKDKTLEELDVIFSRPTRDIVRENWASTKETIRDMFRGDFRKVLADQAKRTPNVADGLDV